MHITWFDNCWIFIGLHKKWLDFYLIPRLMPTFIVFTALNFHASAKCRSREIEGKDTLTDDFNAKQQLQIYLNFKIDVKQPFAEQIILKLRYFLSFWIYLKYVLFFYAQLFMWLLDQQLCSVFVLFVVFIYV